MREDDFATQLKAGVIAGGIIVVLIAPVWLVAKAIDRLLQRRG